MTPIKTFLFLARHVLKRLHYFEVIICRTLFYTPENSYSRLLQMPFEPRHMGSEITHLVRTQTFPKN